MVSMPAEDTDVSAERDYALHLARRILDQASQALMEGRAGSIRIPRTDPLFGAVCARSLQLLADRLGQPQAPETPHNQTPNRKSPDAINIRTNSKEQQS